MKKKFDYTWVIIALCFMSVCVSLGFCSSGRTLYLTAITEALNIKRSAFSLNDTFRFITTTIMSIFFGPLVNKFGTKKLMCAGYLCLIAFALINSFAEHLLLFYVAGVLLGVGLSWTGTTMVGAIINTWCTKNKGTITGAVFAANGLGGAVAVQILSPMIFEEGNPFGYRKSYRLVALILAVVLILVIIFMKDRPKGAEKVNLPTKKKHKMRGEGWVGMEYDEAKKKPYLYLVLLCVMLTGMSLKGIGGIAVPHMYDIGMDKAYVATLVTISSLLLMGSKFLTGFMYDKLGIRITMNIALVCTFLSLGALVMVSNTPLGNVIALARIVFSAVALPLETVMIPLYARELFGDKCFVKIMGLFAAANYAGFAVGAPFANLCYDFLGNYNLAFVILAILMLFVTVAMQYVMVASSRDRKLILKALEENAEKTAEKSAETAPTA